MFFAFIHMTFPPKLLIALIWSGECMMSSIKWGINYLWEKKAKEGNDPKAPICAECQGCTKSMPSLKAQHNSIGSKIRLLFSIFFSHQHWTKKARTYDKVHPRPNFLFIFVMHRWLGGMSHFRYPPFQCVDSHGEIKFRKYVVAVILAAAQAW